MSSINANIDINTYATIISIALDEGDEGAAETALQAVIEATGLATPTLDKWEGGSLGFLCGGGTALQALREIENLGLLDDLATFTKALKKWEDEVAKMVG